MSQAISSEQYYSSIYAQMFLTAQSTDSSNSTDSSEETSTSSAQDLFTQTDIAKSYGLQSLSALSYAAEATFEGLGLNSNESVTFSQILGYKEEIQEKFSSKVADELEELGIPRDAKYTIATDYETGEIVVSSDSEYKAEIEKYFADNPEIVEEFQQIQYLSNLERASSNSSISEAQNVTKQQLQAMASSFYANPSSSIMSSYGTDSTSFGMGLSTMV